MNLSNACLIKMNDLFLTYQIHHGSSNNLKETIINLFKRKKIVQQRVEKINALNDVTLEIKEGDRLGVIGLNGAGKSTILKVISGILKPTGGQIHVTGAIQPLIEIGAGFDPEFTGRENIYFNGYMLGFTKAQLKEKEQEIIQFSELGEFIDVPIKYYSSGMSVRLAFTIATIIQPEILLIDEMLSAGDAAFIEKAKKRLNQLLDTAKIIVLVSHDLSVVKSMCNRIVVLDRGKIVFNGHADEGLKKYDEIVRSKIESGN